MANASVPMVERIKNAAFELLTTQGPAALSMRNLALRLQIKAPSLYKHIAGKDDLISFIQMRGLESFRDSVAFKRGSRRSQILAYRKWAIANPYLYEVTMRTPLLREMLPAGLEDSVTAIIVKIAGGSRAKARVYWSLLHGMVDLELAGRFPSGANLDQMWNEAVRMMQS